MRRSEHVALAANQLDRYMSDTIAGLMDKLVRSRILLTTTVEHRARSALIGRIIDLTLEVQDATRGYTAANNEQEQPHEKDAKSRTDC